eukprot:3324958-Amphidinium_carterae.1
MANEVPSKSVVNIYCPRTLFSGSQLCPRRKQSCHSSQPHPVVRCSTMCLHLSVLSEKDCLCSACNHLSNPPPTRLNTDIFKLYTLLRHSNNLSKLQKSEGSQDKT